MFAGPWLDVECVDKTIGKAAPCRAARLFSTRVRRGVAVVGRLFETI